MSLKPGCALEVFNISSSRTPDQHILIQKVRRWYFQAASWMISNCSQDREPLFHKFVFPQCSWETFLISNSRSFHSVLRMLLLWHLLREAFPNYFPLSPLHHPGKSKSQVIWTGLRFVILLCVIFKHLSLVCLSLSYLLVPSLRSWT